MLDIANNDSFKNSNLGRKHAISRGIKQMSAIQS